MLVAMRDRLFVYAVITTLFFPAPAALGEPGDQPQPAQGPTCFRGEWSEPLEGGECAFSFELRLTSSSGRATAVFDWRLRRCPGLEGREGQRGVERATGTIGNNGVLTLTGRSVSDRTLLSTDEYRLVISGDRVSGLTRTNEGDWNGRISGQRVVCGSE
jgi:hypothetical protein